MKKYILIILVVLSVIINLLNIDYDNLLLKNYFSIALSFLIIVFAVYFLRNKKA